MARFFRKEQFFYIIMIAVSMAVSVKAVGRLSDASPVSADPTSYIAIVIDDFGYGGEGTNEMLSLPIPLTAAVMPFSPKTSEAVSMVKEAGKELIIHMPMQSKTGKKSWVGDKAVFTNMSDEEIKSVVIDAFKAVDGAIGINNHMGSAIMEDKRAFGAVMDAVNSLGGSIFLDSVTTPNSVAAEVCKQKGIKELKRDVFLDSTDDIEVVKKQLRLAAKIAKNNGYAVAIGHVGPEGGLVTVNAIKALAPQLEKEGIQFVTISQLNEIISPALDQAQ